MPVPTLSKRSSGRDAANQLRANSAQGSGVFGPVCGLIFLRFGAASIAAQRAKLEKAAGASRRASPVDDKPMRSHTLMQTIARANRVFPCKHSGLIVDYARKLPLK